MDERLHDDIRLSRHVKQQARIGFVVEVTEDVFAARRKVGAHKRGCGGVRVRVCDEGIVGTAEDRRQQGCVTGAALKSAATAQETFDGNLVLKTGQAISGEGQQFETRNPRIGSVRRQPASLRRYAVGRVQPDQQVGPGVGRADDVRGRRIGRIGKVDDSNVVQARRRDGNDRVVRLPEAAHGERVDWIGPGWKWLRPGERGVGVLVADTRVAGAFVEHERIGAAIAVEITGGEEFGWGFVNESGVSGGSVEQ